MIQYIMMKEINIYYREIINYKSKFYKFNNRKIKITLKFNNYKKKL